ncbi:aldo/keto reductase [Flaviflexus ciconiae]|uniref:Aldo/keto reductase n=1 Tax=Flaviflexus ciconiae TaxID=2496867 RepID=A0A3Q9G0A8_9ACTO|nr:aldo/keto reductase [Flaviflexus ciconiae]AZQ76057.1 aldo/keto reductase [Flaviflexus ciconiae]
MNAQVDFNSLKIGFGTSPLMGEEATTAVASALDAGYTFIDTASKYENEEAVGQGIKASGVAREDVILQTKLRGNDHGDVRGALERSLSRLGVDYLDAWLIHWPLPMLGLYPEAYEEMAKAQEEGLVRTLGVSNFLIEHLDELKAKTGLVPATNQVQVDPGLHRPEYRKELADRGIAVQSWSPLSKGGDLFETEAVVSAAEAHSITPSQAVLAWHRAIGAIPIVRSTNEERRKQNLEAVEVQLTPAEVEAISALPQRELGEWDPATHDER